MRDQTHSSFQTPFPAEHRQTWRPSILLDQLTTLDHSAGDDATGLTDWIRIWEQAPWRRT